MQVSSNNSSHYIFLLSFIFMFMGYLKTHASTINDAETVKSSILISDSYTNGQQEFYLGDVSPIKNDLNINSDGASITDLNSETTIFTFLGNVEIISAIVVIECDKAVLEFKNNE